MYVTIVPTRASAERTANMKKCCICGKKFTGFGNNPWPVVRDENAVCCDECNNTKVVPERINLVMGYEYGTEQSKQR